MLMLFWLLNSSILHAEVPKKLPPPKERGENLYKELCWQCHGSLGNGDGPLSKMMQVPVLAGIAKEKEKEYIDIIQNGKDRMPAYAEVIDRHDSRRILLWLRNPVPKEESIPTKESKKKEKSKEEKK